MSYTYEWPRPGFTADIAVICEGKVLTVQRKNEPYINRWVLPGGFINEGETSREAAIRELEEETKLVIPKSLLLNFHFVGLYDAVGRDPRGWTISALYLWAFGGTSLPEVIASDDAKDFRWISVYNSEEINKLGFDHARMVYDAESKFFDIKGGPL